MKTLKIKTFSTLLIFILAATIFYACKKTYSVDESPAPINLVTASIAGLITDLNNVPISNASVSAGTSTTTTDINGHFTLKNAQLDKDAGYVKITMTGYFGGSRTFLVNSNTVNNVRIQLIPKTVTGNFATGSGGNINVLGGGSVSFGAGNVVRASSGTSYTGNVSVTAFYLNPIDVNFNEFMPGDLRGTSASNQQGILKVFGMASIEMDAASGEKLQLAAGHTATISLPIPSALQVSGPASIPLWYFDETTVSWKQQGTATKQGNNYVGTVSHFSFWAAGVFAHNIKYSASFTMDTTGFAYTNKLVTISTTGSATTSSYTDSTGTVRGLVPINEILTMKLFNDCGENIYSQDIGPFSRDTVLGNIIVARNVCYPADTSQYIKLSFNNRHYFWPSFHIRQSFQTGNFTYIMGGSQDNLSDSSTLFEGYIFSGNTSVGTYPIGLYVVVNGTVTYQAGGLSYDPTYAYPTTNITKYNSIGGYIEGSISGWIKTFPSIATADSFPVSGNYRVKRIQ